MFCNQCEQTSKGIGCATVGVCGKKPEVAALLDLLTHSISQLSEAAVQARAKGIVDSAINRFTSDALFVTLTNVNFDPAAVEKYINSAAEYTKELSKQAGSTCSSLQPHRH